MPTEAGDVPTTGTAIYDAYVGGFGGYVEGTAELRVDFANGTLAGSVEALLNDGIGGLATIGRHDLTEVSYTRGGTVFSGRLAVPGAVADSFFEGRFTGPGASELMVRWRARVNDPHNPGQQITLHGVWIGRRR